MSQANPPIETLPAIAAPWQDIVLTCRKCTRKLDGGFGPKRRLSLREMLKAGLRAAGMRRQFRVVEIGCLGLCPKNAVTLVRASRPGVMLRVPAGAAFDALLPVLLAE